MPDHKSHGLAKRTDLRDGSGQLVRIFELSGILTFEAPGKGLATEQANTLAWLIHYPYLMDYVRWLIYARAARCTAGYQNSWMT